LTLASNIRCGVEQLVRVSGIGAMKPNTVLIGFKDNNDHIDDLASPTSPFFNPDLGGVLETDESDPKISDTDYVGIIEDTLKMQKNVCLCRNFQSLDRTDVFSTEIRFRVGVGKKKYLDVWPVNFLESSETNTSDNTSLFMFQLSCIVNMVPKWKQHKMRVFMCVRATDHNIRSKETELKQLMKMLRIKAETYVLMRDHLPEIEEADAHNSQSNTIVTDEYLSAVNELIRVNCAETAVTFIYLPRPPQDPNRHPLYLSMLDKMTRNLPPSLLVHGVSPVITTTL